MAKFFYRMDPGIPNCVFLLRESDQYLTKIDLTDFYRLPNNWFGLGFDYGKGFFFATSKKVITM